MEIVRVQYAVFASKDEAIAAGYVDAEYGYWQQSPGGEIKEGWIGLEEAS